MIINTTADKRSSSNHMIERPFKPSQFYGPQLLLFEHATPKQWYICLEEGSSLGLDMMCLEANTCLSSWVFMCSWRRAIIGGSCTLLSDELPKPVNSSPMLSFFSTPDNIPRTSLNITFLDSLRGDFHRDFVNISKYFHLL